MAINGRFLLPRLEGIGHFTAQILNAFCESHPDDELHVLVDRPCAHPVLINSNIQTHVVPPKTRHPLLWYYWFEVALPARLRKIKPDVFYSPE